MTNYEDWLAPPPRSVPLAWRLAQYLEFRFWEMFVLFMVGVSPVALWIFYPMLLGVVGTIVVAGGVWWRINRAGLRNDLLAWGVVARVTGVQNHSYTGTSYQNVRLAQARGWERTTQWYSGPGHSTEVGYTLNGVSGTVKVGPLPYADGVILADSRNPEQALCVSSFGYELSRDDFGEWTGALKASTAIGCGVTVLAYGAWLLAAILGPTLSGVSVG